MIVSLLSCLGALPLSGCGGGQGLGRLRAPLSPRQIAERVIPSMVLIKVPGGLGSGFTVGADGRIATNLHVIGSARSATVRLADGREFSRVEVLALDARHDLALLRVPTSGLPVLPLGDSAAVRPGDHVVAIGHPLGLGNTVSDGLVSAVRELDATLTVLQVSAPISAGSSGGPLLNERGEVIGVSTAIAAHGQNLNFGIPVGYLKPLMSRAGQRGTPIGGPRAGGPGGRRPGSVPHHALTLLDGCPEADQLQIVRTISHAIELGAPLCNEGNREACFRVYQAAALELDRGLATCAGPRRALLDGVDRAARAPDFEQRTWLMRDAFDGLVDVIERHLGP